MGYRELYNEWLSNPAIDDETKAELKKVEKDEKQIEDRFYTELNFGTAGLRGIIGAGTNRMNKYVIRKATQGLADYINERTEDAGRGIVIAYDSRIKSDEFALEAALVLCDNGIKTYLFETLRSVPQLSFAVRYLKCIGGIVITASHNPAQYNGYKVYWENGGQIGPIQADIITEHIKKTGFKNIGLNPDTAKQKGLLTLIGKEVDEAYYRAVESLMLRRDLMNKANDFSIVYTPLHGTGNLPVQRILSDMGFGKIYIVKEQMLPDGNFPTVKAPNPESHEAYRLAFKLADEKGANVILATDPDADRLGVAVRCKDGEFIILSGNQIGCLLEYYILHQLKSLGRLPSNGLVVKSIVSTNMANAIARYFGVAIEEVLTGFRFIAEKIEDSEKTGEHSFLFGFEESYGFLSGMYVRDKDAICASMLIAEAALWYDSRGMTLYEGLMELFEIYGYYNEKVASYTLTGKEGLEKIRRAMELIRNNPPDEIGGTMVVALRDYQTGKRVDLRSGEESMLETPESDVIYFELEDGAWVCVRPSGTEPKLKLYVNANARSLKAVGEKLNRLFCNADDILKRYLD